MVIKMKDTGISAVAGVIAIFMITLLIAIPVFIYVESVRTDEKDSEVFYIDGFLEKIETNYKITLNNKSIDVWEVTLVKDFDGDTEIYFMIFDETYPPLEGFQLRFFYNKFVFNDTEYLEIYDIKKV